MPVAEGRNKPEDRYAHCGEEHSVQRNGSPILIEAALLVVMLIVVVMKLLVVVKASGEFRDR